MARYRGRNLLYEKMDLDFWRAIFAEFLGTMLYVFVVCGAHVIVAVYNGVTTYTNTPTDFPHDQVSPIIIGLASGLAYATMVQMFGLNSGGHFNPAVTIGMVIGQKITILRAFLYLCAQVVGGIAGAAIMYGLSPTSTVARNSLRNYIGITTPGMAESGFLTNADVTSAQALGVEIMFTFILVFTIFATVDPHRKVLGSASLSIGLPIAIASFAGLFHSGASLNPARSLGPAVIVDQNAIFTNRWTDHWVYWVGPILGGGVAALLYEFIFNPLRYIADDLDIVDQDVIDILKYLAHKYRGMYMMADAEPIVEDRYIVDGPRPSLKPNTPVYRKPYYVRANDAPYAMRSEPARALPEPAYPMYPRAEPAYPLRQLNGPAPM
ncbi:lens fiber major intrinsic protein-like [Branchiostoma floridae x Branchiostoma japonicum]